MMLKPIFQFVTFFAFASIIVSSYSCNNNIQNNSKSEAKNQVHYSKWSASSDTKGSYYQPKKITVVDSIVAVSFYREPSTAAEPTWVELICHVDKKLTSTKSIEITYKCDKPLIIKLFQKDFGGEGNQTYSHYQRTIPLANKFVTQTVNIKNFVLPDWAPKESKNIALNLDNVSKIYLVPDIADEEGGNAKLEVKSLKIY